MGDATFIGGWAIVIALTALSFYLPIKFWRRWEGTWKIVALLPIAIPLSGMAAIVWGKIIDPISHRFFLFEMMIAAFCSLFAAGIIAAIQKISQNGTQIFNKK